MKPRNDRERLVVKLSAKIPALTKAQKDYCTRHCFDHTAIKRKKSDTQYICLECGNKFVAEGDAMHHCVETYWKHTDCLILSVRCGRKRLATVELDNKSFAIRQCRAVCNGVPERYDEICGIIKAHKRDFVKAARVRKVA